MEDKARLDKFQREYVQDTEYTLKAAQGEATDWFLKVYLKDLAKLASHLSIIFSQDGKEAKVFDPKHPDAKSLVKMADNKVTCSCGGVALNGNPCACIYKFVVAGNHPMTMLAPPHVLKRICRAQHAAVAEYPHLNMDELEVNAKLKVSLL